MKTKTALSAITSLMLASAMCMGFVSCGAEEEDGDVRAKIDALTGEEVTEEVWNAALYSETDIFNNVCNNFAIDFVETYNNEDGTETTTSHCIHVDSQCYTRAIMDYSALSGKSPKEKYVEENAEKVGERIYKNESYFDSTTEEYLVTVNGQWGEGHGDGAFDLGLAYLTNMTGIVCSERGLKYSDYSYNEEQNGYVYTATNDYGSDTLVVKFAEGKLKSVQYTHRNTDESNIEYLYYITYGGQSVTRPEVG